MNEITEEWLMRIDDEANARSTSYANSPSNRPFSEGYETVGLTGEAQFACEFGLPLNWGRRVGGDPGWDFVLPVRRTLDVKCYRGAFSLLVEPHKVRADFYCLSDYSDETRRATLKGWATAQEVRAAPIKNVLGVDNHCLEKLRDMDDLRRMVMRLT